jgi:hypothetical protein
MARSAPDDSHSRWDDLLQGSRAALRLVQTLTHLNNLQRIFARHSHYDPNQPRVPAGHTDGGQWTNMGGSQEHGSARAASRSNASNRSPEISYAAELAASHPEEEWSPAATRRLPPGIPPRRPPSGERSSIFKEVAKWLRENAGQVIEGVAWLDEFLATIESYLDPPKTLEELQQADLTRKKGYDVHHIVEQTPAAQDHFPREDIDAPENRVLIPRMKHWEITAWYAKQNKLYGGQSPREYLRGKGWDERRRVGLQALIDHGVLKP